MESIKRNDTGAAVEDVQNRLVKAGLLSESNISGVFDDATVSAIHELCRKSNIEQSDEVTEAVWTKLVDASFELGDRNLYLRVPFFHGADVETLQSALSALGFSCGDVDGMFGAHTEDAVRKFQLNMGLPSDGICGAMTFRALHNLRHSWVDKGSFRPIPHLGFARAAEVLDSNMMCLYGVSEFTRSVAARMSNLALATSPSSMVTSADSLLVKPDDSTLFVQILAGSETPDQAIPVVEYSGEESLAYRIAQAIQASSEVPERIAVRLPGESWQDAGEARSAQHYAIVLLDAVCSALLLIQEQKGA